jgi:hypothetical protein
MFAVPRAQIQRKFCNVGWACKIVGTFKFSDGYIDESMTYAADLGQGTVAMTLYPFGIAYMVPIYQCHRTSS